MDDHHRKSEEEHTFFLEGPFSEPQKRTNLQTIAAKPTNMHYVGSHEELELG